MAWWRRVILHLSQPLSSPSREVYALVRPDDLLGQPYFTFTAGNDHEACKIARQVMKGNGQAEVWAGTRLVDIL